jgi:hypothetical protein
MQTKPASRHRAYDCQFDPELNSEGSAESFERDGVQLCQLVERQFRFLIRQGEPDDNVLTAQLPPKPIRRPLLRLRPAQTFNPNKIPLRHRKRPKTRTLRKCDRCLSYCPSPANWSRVTAKDVGLESDSCDWLNTKFQGSLHEQIEPAAHASRTLLLHRISLKSLAFWLYSHSHNPARSRRSRGYVGVGAPETGLVYDRNGNKMPNMNHAGVYSTIRAHLEAVARKKSDDGL